MAKKLVSTSSMQPPYDVGDKVTAFTYKDKLGNVYPIETKGLQMAPILVGSTQVLIPKRYKDTGVQIGTMKIGAKKSTGKKRKLKLTPCRVVCRGRDKIRICGKMTTKIGTCGKSTAKASSPKPKKSGGGSSGGKVVLIPLDRANTYFQKNKGARSKDYLRTTKV